MRMVMIFALGAMLTACAQPTEPAPQGPASLPAHPVGDVTKPTELPPPANASGKSASAGTCAGKSGQNSCN